ncbi:16035_t:CDS:2, partial [Funneliformis caledonium]
DTYFGLCFGGCGIGKTELVTQFCMKMIKEYKNVLVLDLNNAFHSFDQNLCKDDQWLGLSLATVYFGRRKLELSEFIKTILCNHGEESLKAFDNVSEVLTLIVNHYRKWKSIEGTLCVVVWKDDYQTEMEQLSNPRLNVIKKLGNYNHSSFGTSIAAEQDVVLVPILSGTFGGDVKKTIIGSRHSAKVLSTPPLSFDASIRVLGISKEVLEQSSFKLRILISDIGGVARLLMDLRRMNDFTKPLEERDVDNLGSQMVNRVSECYSIVTPQGQQNLTTFPKSALKELIRCIITGTSIYDGTQLPETEVTYTDLDRYGIFHYRPLSNDQFVITMPYILLWKLNNEVALLPCDLLTFPCRRWTWQDFERLEAYLETLRAGRGTTIKEQFPHAYANANVLKWKIEPWEQMLVEQEAVQCVPRTGTVDWTGIHSQMYGHNLYILSPVVFLCHTGNPAIDSHSSRRSGSKYIGLLKQTKHSAPKTKGKIFSSEVIRWYNNAMEKFNNARIFESIGFILFTNRDISKIEREKALAACPNLIIICRDNLENYMSHTFLYRGF